MQSALDSFTSFISCSTFCNFQSQASEKLGFYLANRICIMRQDQPFAILSRHFVKSNPSRRLTSFNRMPSSMSAAYLKEKTPK